ncbi:hypothetical protein SAMN05445060_3349 [Williamsia sterculiae]|uniref:Uncharacterized protein n=1 Tax=Williamsia sterculiae TaxID=1344003 RepID=A0A1N7H131_9NOCA|nr:hypothetical protein SAMN05445060_3349 [Williamsia sterculiae]
MQKIMTGNGIHKDLRPTSVRVNAETLQLVFKWRSNPNSFAITRRLPQTADELRSPADTPAEWALYMTLMWQEELSTGLLVRGTRRRVDGVIYIEEPAKTALDPEHGYTYSFYHQDISPDADGLVHITHGQSPHNRRVSTYNPDQLIGWEIAARHSDAESMRYVGKAVTSWTGSDGVASLDILDTRPGTPPHIVERIAFKAVHAAADAGALEVTTTLAIPVLAAVGFAPASSNHLTLDVRSMP